MLIGEKKYFDHKMQGSFCSNFVKSDGDFMKL